MNSDSTRRIISKHYTFNTSIAQYTLRLRLKQLTLANLSAVTLLQDDLCSPATPPSLSHGTSLSLGCSWGFGWRAQCHRLHSVGEDPPRPIPFRKPVLAARLAHPHHPWPAHDSITSLAHDGSVLRLLCLLNGMSNLTVLLKLSLIWFSFTTTTSRFGSSCLSRWSLSSTPTSNPRVLMLQPKLPACLSFARASSGDRMWEDFLGQWRNKFIWQMMYSLTSGTSPKVIYQNTEEVETSRESGCNIALKTTDFWLYEVDSVVSIL